MDPYLILLLGLGLLVLLVAWLPLLLRDWPLSLPIICVGIGALLFAIPGTGTAPHPSEHPEVTARVCEIVLIIALTGAGLKIDTPFGWRRWRITWRLLAVTMPLSILGGLVIGWELLGFGLPAALLLGAAFAPTDPVLAADVQVGPPRSGEEDEVRFGLTSEAGLNDALAFPFVHLAVAMAAAGWQGGIGLAEWAVLDVAWRCAAGLVMGVAIGRIAGRLAFRLPARARLARTGDGLVALGLTLVAYAATEAVGGYGFLAVFVAALVLRDRERSHRYHEVLHAFSDQIERLLTMLVLVLFGGALSQGLLAGTTPAEAVAAILLLAVVRPVAGMAGLIGSGRPIEERLVISAFGIRGVGTVYYIAFAAAAAEFAEIEKLWTVLGLTILLSILVHGTLVTPTMRILDRRAKRREAGRPAEPS